MELFRNNGINGDMVLADLAEYCGYYQVQHVGASMSELADANARRAVFGRIFHFLHLSEDERRELGEAARREAIARVTAAEEQGVY